MDWSKYQGLQAQAESLKNNSRVQYLIRQAQQGSKTALSELRAIVPSNYPDEVLDYIGGSGFSTSYKAEVQNKQEQEQAKEQWNADYNEDDFNSWRDDQTKNGWERDIITEQYQSLINSGYSPKEAATKVQNAWGEIDVDTNHGTVRPEQAVRQALQKAVGETGDVTAADIKNEVQETVANNNFQNEISEGKGTIDTNGLSLSNVASDDASSEMATKLSEIDQAKQDAAQEAQQQARQNYLGNASAGINRSRAGMLSSNDANSQANVANNYNANRQLGTSTQNDYLQKMAQANALDTQASNLNKATGWNMASGALQGMGSGAAVGATMGLSDERAKEAPIDENLLREQIRQFKTLYRRLQKLKEDK